MNKNIHARLALGFVRMLVGIVTTTIIAGGCWLGNGGLNRVQAVINPPTVEHVQGETTPSDMVFSQSEADGDVPFGMDVVDGENDIFAFVGVQLNPGPIYVLIADFPGPDGIRTPIREIEAEEKAASVDDTTKTDTVRRTDEFIRTEDVVDGEELIEAMVRDGELAPDGEPTTIRNI